MVGIERYQAEPVLMEHVAAAFDRFVDQVETGAELAQRELSRFVAFFREYGDLGHHDKEESILVPVLVRSGFEWSDGPITTMRAEHDQGCYLLGVLRHASLQPGLWSRPQRQSAVSAARSLGDLVRPHIALEEHDVLARAVSALDATAARDLERRTLAFDAEWDANGELSSLRMLADELVTRYQA